MATSARCARSAASSRPTSTSRRRLTRGRNVEPKSKRDSEALRELARLKKRNDVLEERQRAWERFSEAAVRLMVAHVRGDRGDD